jgi:hypothetical protein
MKEERSVVPAIVEKQKNLKCLTTQCLRARVIIERSASASRERAARRRDVRSQRWKVRLVGGGGGGCVR